MKKILYIVACTMVAPICSQAQDQQDALRYSETGVGGTARFMGMGGAFSAVGGDASTLTFNPAGIAVFSKSQFTFTPGFSFQSTNSTYNGMMMTGQASKINIQNAAWIMTWKNTHDDALWKGINFGIAYNRTANFNTGIVTQGNNYNGTMLDQVVNDANGTFYTQLDPYETGPAYNVGLINVTGSDSAHYSNIIDPFLGNGKNYVLQQRSYSSSGSMGETDISFGADYKDKFYIGASIGIPNINYYENVVYTETPYYTDTAYGLQSFNYSTQLHTTGAGVNFKIGFIYKIADWLRVGAAVHTPTAFSLSDDYSSTWTASYSGGTQYLAGTFSDPQNGNNSTYNYTIVTPMRLMGGVAAVLAHKAIISADYEYVNYSTAYIHSSDYSFSGPNQIIAQDYMAASNIRVGAEYVLFPFSIRAGYSLYGNPYSSAAGNNSVHTSYSLGFGIRIKQWFIDMAYVLTQYNENYFMYSGANAASNSTNVSNVAFTFGVNL